MAGEGGRRTQAGGGRHIMASRVDNQPIKDSII